MKRKLSDYLDFLISPSGGPRPQVAWRPAVDVYRCDRGWLVKFDLAGVRAEDIEIHVSGQQVRVTGKRRDMQVYARQEPHLMEIAYSQFERSVELPEKTEHVEVRSEYCDGMLLVHVLAKEKQDQ